MTQHESTTLLHPIHVQPSHLVEYHIVRAAAVNSLFRFGLQDSDPEGQITTLLERCLYDVDDEVQDRASMNLRMLRQSHIASRLDQKDSKYKLSALETSLQSCMKDPTSSTKVFDVSAVPTVTRQERRQKELRAKNEAASKVIMASESQKAGPSTGLATLVGCAIATNVSGAAHADTADAYAAEVVAILDFRAAHELSGTCGADDRRNRVFRLGGH
jgi:coatomer protein complex subunit gamma